MVDTEIVVSTTVLSDYHIAKNMCKRMVAHTIEEREKRTEYTNKVASSTFTRYIYLLHID